jgi:nitrogen regulatory protein P-II 2
VKIEIAVPDDVVERTIEAVQKAAHTGHIGDGKIFVTPLERAVRIRTGESDDDAL